MFIVVRVAPAGIATLMSLLVLFSISIVSALFLYVLEPLWDFSTALYFVFVTATTIGMNLQHLNLIVCLFFDGTHFVDIVVLFVFEDYFFVFLMAFRCVYSFACCGVGYGDIAPTNDASRLFVTFYAVAVVALDVCVIRWYAATSRLS